jgi:DNA-binding protein YbaB
VNALSTRALIEQARSREAALSQVSALMAQARGTAHASDGTVEVTVDAFGSMHRLWLAPSVINADPSRLSALIIDVSSAAMTEAAQDSYNKVALLLGAEMTELVEQLSGVPAPARAADDDPGMTVEEFQRRRAERLGERTVTAAPVADVPADDDWTTFDPASLRSDR